MASILPKMVLSLLCMLIIGVLGCETDSVNGLVACEQPPYATSVNFVEDSTGRNSHDSAVLVQEKCPELHNRSVASWRRGLKVKGNCDKLPQYTAIATFAGRNSTYNRVGLQHAAIFVSCNSHEIRAYDQAPNLSGVRLRRLRFGGSNSASNGNLFYTIN